MACFPRVANVMVCVMLGGCCRISVEVGAFVYVLRVIDRLLTACVWSHLPNKGESTFYDKKQVQSFVTQARAFKFSHLSRLQPVRKNLLDIEQKFAILGTSKAADGLPQPTRSYSERAHSSNCQALIRVHEYELYAASVRAITSMRVKTLVSSIN